MKVPPSEVRTQDFRVRMRGYDRPEVDAFLLRVAEQIDELAKKNEQLSLQCQDLFEQCADLRKERDDLRQTVASVNVPLEAAAAKAEELIRKAQADSERMLEESRTEVSNLTGLRDKLLVDLCEMFRAQIRLLETESKRVGVDISHLLGEGDENVIQIPPKAKGDAL